MGRKLTVTLFVAVALMLPPLVSYALNATDSVGGPSISDSSRARSASQVGDLGRKPTRTPRPTITLTPLPTNTRTPVPTNTPTPLPTNTPTPLPTNTPTPLPTDTPQPPPPPPAGCPFGGRASGQGPAALAAALQGRSGTFYQVIDWSDTQYFAQIPGSIRAIRAESLAEMQASAEQAVAQGIEYEALTYDLEGWEQTPIWEQEHQVEATIMARDIAHSFGKLLVMAPARALTWRNWSQMAPYADMWVIQAQAGQRNYGAGPEFANWLAPYVGYLSTHPGMPIWAQLTTFPDRALTMDEYFAYVDSVRPSLVDGVYVFNPDQRLPWASVFNRACPLP